MLIRTNLLIVWELTAYGLEGSNPSTPTNLMNRIFITLEIAIIATIGFTYFHEDDYRKGKNS